MTTLVKSGSQKLETNLIRCEKSSIAAKNRKDITFEKEHIAMKFTFIDKRDMFIENTITHQLG